MISFVIKRMMILFLITISILGVEIAWWVFKKDMVLNDKFTIAVFAITFIGLAIFSVIYSIYLIVVASKRFYGESYEA